MPDSIVLIAAPINEQYDNPAVRNHMQGGGATMQQPRTVPILPDAPAIQFDAIHVNSITNGSGVFIGTNTQVLWSTSSKVNSGVGEISGEHNRMEQVTNVIYDNDIIDAPYTKGDLIIGRV
ncbi:hypothetical protein [Paenibacillus whitsoniae]|uniref:Uncharacterized protein n=1 Tax=Paenibacillus whitsoniae TaxID=2496558 RepID=A0A430JFP7_9BACL|nr:hypothetical protein [Paenibacillus whitsoniae]RTE09859.1 hypothetical protein EJQ19_10000 [Paenibacillus whitsoniae]